MICSSLKQSNPSQINSCEENSAVHGFVLGSSQILIYAPANYQVNCWDWEKSLKPAGPVRQQHETNEVKQTHTGCEQPPPLPHLNLNSNWNWKWARPKYLLRPSTAQSAAAEKLNQEVNPQNLMDIYNRQVNFIICLLFSSKQIC